MVNRNKLLVTEISCGKNVTVNGFKTKVDELTPVQYRSSTIKAQKRAEAEAKKEARKDVESVMSRLVLNFSTIVETLVL